MLLVTICLTQVRRAGNCAIRRTLRQRFVIALHSRYKVFKSVEGQSLRVADALLTFYLTYTGW